MNPRSRAFAGPLLGLLALSVLLAGCGTASPAATKAESHRAPPKVQRAAQTPPQPFHGALPALDAVQFVTPAVGFLAGQGIVLSTGDGGATWTQIYDGPQTIRTLDFVSATEGWALTASGTVLSYNGKGRWQSVAASLGPVSAIHLSASGPSLLVTVQGTLYRAAQAEGPWQRERLADVQALAFSGSSAGWAVTTGAAGPEVFATGDGGQTWTPSFTPTLGQAQGWLPSLSASGGTAWLLLTSVGGQLGHQPYVAYATSAGQPWHEVLAAPLFAVQGLYPATPGSLSGFDAGPFAAAGTFASFLSWAPGTPHDLLWLSVTANGGQTWSQLPVSVQSPLEIPAFFAGVGIALAGGNTVWLAGSRGGRGLALFSNDGGAHWQAAGL